VSGDNKSKDRAEQELAKLRETISAKEQVRIRGHNLLTKRVWPDEFAETIGQHLADPIFCKN
jgi:hypothetical protein